MEPMTPLALTAALIVLPGVTVPQPTGPLPPHHDTPTTTQHQPPTQHRTTPGTPTRIAPQWSPGDGAEFWREHVAAYFPADRVDAALSVMDCESGGNPDADNPTSSASGLFQHLATYWPQRSADAGWAGASIWDPAPNIAVAAWLSAGGSDWSHWVCKP